MLRIELSRGEKIQIGLIVLILAIAVYFVLSANRLVLDSSVNGWTTVRNFPVDPAKPASTSNPYDPKKQMTVNVFACYDGQLEIREFKRDPTRSPSIVWVKPDLRRKSYLYYIDPMSPVKEIKDPYKHALYLAAYSKVNGKTLGLLGQTSLTPDQLKIEKQARDQMEDALVVLNGSVDNGSFHPELMARVMEALKAFKSIQGDTTKDAGKAALAHKVLAACHDYLAKIQEEKSAIIEKYLAKVDALLTATQRQALAKAGEPFDYAGNKLGAAKVAAPPKPKAATAAKPAAATPR